MSEITVPDPPDGATVRRVSLRYEDDAGTALAVQELTEEL